MSGSTAINGNAAGGFATTRASSYRSEPMGPAQRERLEAEKADRQLSPSVVERKVSSPPASEASLAAQAAPARSEGASRGRTVDISV